MRKTVKTYFIDVDAKETHSLFVHRQIKYKCVTILSN